MRGGGFPGRRDADGEDGRRKGNDSMLLSEMVYNSFFFNWEIALEEWIQSVFPDALIHVLSWLSSLGEELVIFAVIGLIYWAFDKKFGRYLAISMIMVNVWNCMIKNVVLRRRPYFESEDIDLKRLVDPGADKYSIAAQGYSFPSGHSSGAAALYGGMARYTGNRALKVLAVILPLLVGASRIVVGAHYPTDVAAGLCLGAFVVFFVPWLEGKLKDRRLFYGVLLASAVPGFFYCRSTDYFTAVGMLFGFIASVPFEEKFVRFENTKSPLRRTLRVVGGLLVFLALRILLKLPFSEEFLASKTAAAYAVRVIRYAVMQFTALAVYPILFKYTARIGRKTK